MMEQLQRFILLPLFGLMLSANSTMEELLPAQFSSSSTQLTAQLKTLFQQLLR